MSNVFDAIDKMYPEVGENINILREKFEKLNNYYMERQLDNSIINQIKEMLLYTQCFFYSSQINTKRLEKNSFSQYSLSKQLRMICIFIQDQSRLMKEQLDREKGKKSYNTGMEENYSEYKYMVPVVSLEYLIKQFVLLYGYEKNLAKKLLDNFVFNEHLRKEEGDIFSRPLLKVNENQVLLCESLIEQINLERNVEQWLKKYDVDLFPVGFQFENKLREKIGSINGIEVNSNKFTFTAYDGKDVEFDVFCDNIEADVLSYL